MWLINCVALPAFEAYSVLIPELIHYLMLMKRNLMVLVPFTLVILVPR